MWALPPVCAWPAAGQRDPLCMSSSNFASLWSWASVGGLEPRSYFQRLEADRFASGAWSVSCFSAPSRATCARRPRRPMCVDAVCVQRFRSAFIVFGSCPKAAGSPRRTALSSLAPLRAAAVRNLPSAFRCTAPSAARMCSLKAGYTNLFQGSYLSLVRPVPWPSLAPPNPEP